MTTSEELVYLIVLYRAVNGSLKAGVPIDGIVAKLTNRNKKYARKILKKLRNNGYVLIKSRGRNITYYLTRAGRDHVHNL